MRCRPLKIRTLVLTLKMMDVIMSAKTLAEMEAVEILPPLLVRRIRKSTDYYEEDANV